jgi:hypothetical protein
VADARGLRRAPKRERRSHAERTAETRAKILAAVVDSIAEVGFHRTTAVEITRRAGVTCRAHPQSDKDGIWSRCSGPPSALAARLKLIDRDMSLERRAVFFVERAFEHFTSREYVSTFEILLDHLRRRIRRRRTGALAAQCCAPGIASGGASSVTVLRKRQPDSSTTPSRC